MLVEILALGSVFAVSAVSLIGIAAFSLKEAWLKALIPALVALAAGALLGDAFIHLIPESLEIIGSSAYFGVSVLVGIGSFFVLEKYLRWHHAHHGDELEHEAELGHNHEGAPHHLGALVLVADGLHNIVDGAVIAGAFLINPAAGFATTIAVILHEIPQEIADYALLVHAGYTRGEALFFNFLSGLTALLGAGTVLWFGVTNPLVGAYTGAFTAGAFVYIAASDIIPELHKTKGLAQGITQLAALSVGVGAMLLLVLTESL